MKRTSTWISEHSVETSTHYEEDGRLILGQTVPDGRTVVCVVEGKLFEEWPSCTVGELRQWLEEKAKQAAAVKDFVQLPGVAEHIVEAAARREAQGLPPLEDSPGAKVEGERGSAAPTEAAVPGPIGGDYVTGVGIQTPAPSFPPKTDDEIPF